MTRALRFILVHGAGALLALSIAVSAASAVDGVIEINQSAVLRNGGFPFTILAPGSYRLTSNLEVTNPNANAILVGEGPATIDLNGFTIRGPLTWGGGETPCSAPGTGYGIAGSENGTVVRNGRIVGFATGLLLSGRGNRVERVIAEGNCGDGIGVGSESLVIDSIARLNRGTGIRSGGTSRVGGSLAEANQIGIVLNDQTIVESCAASGNLNSGVTGLAAGASCLVRNSRVTNNGFNGIVVGVGSLVLDNVVGGNLATQILGATAAAAQVGSGGNAVSYPPGTTGYFYLLHLYCDLEHANRLCSP